MKIKLLTIFFCFFAYCYAGAQLCNGSLGDPVVNMTFGSGTTNVGALKSGVTNLTYTRANCPNDGEYTITKLTSECFGFAWHSFLADHTGDKDGLFMLVNASPLPSQFYVDTVSGLCANTVFEFATWVANVLRPNACNGAGVKPNLTFLIETVTGSLIQKFDSGDIPFEAIGTWRQYGTFFKTPAGVNRVVLRIINNSPGGSQCGNDLALDDITFRPCGPTITATVNNVVQSLIEICETDKSDFLFKTSFPIEYSSPVVQWQVSTDTGKTWKDITGERSLSYLRKATAGGVYQYRAVMADASNFSSPTCRVASNVTTINVNALPDAPADKNLLGCAGNDYVFQDVAGVGFTYAWKGPKGFTSQLQNPVLPNITFSDSGYYIATITTTAGCTRTDTFHMTVFPGTKATVSAGTNICEGTSTFLSASGGVNYLWVPSTGLSDKLSANPIAAPVDTTNYKVIVTNQYGCRDSANVLINVFKKLIVNAGTDQSIFEGDTVTLAGSVKGAASSVYWLPNTNIQNNTMVTPVVSPVDNTTYTLYAVSPQGCPLESDDAFVRVYKKLRIPNIFSPNGDGINDTWAIQNIDTYPLATVKVFTRSGRVVFESKTLGLAWDGTLNGKAVPVATYYYVIDLHVGLAPLSGWVVIVR
jgi:gliding motility-associated-like protein